jgi:hypothetical protein
MKTIAILLAAAAAVIQASQPTFSSDFVALISQHVVVNQGGVANNDGSVTCPAQAPECKVQTEFQASRNYYSVTAQKQKIAAADNSGIIVDYKANKEYQVDSNNVCQAYCPIPKNQQGALTPLSLDPNSTYIGAVNGPLCAGGTCQFWQANQTQFDIVFQTDNFYIQPNGTEYIPVTFNSLLTPFGIPMGYQTQVFYNFAPGCDAKVFDMGNATSCPMSNQCSSGNDDTTSSQNAHNNRMLAMYSSPMVDAVMTTYENAHQAKVAFGAAPETAEQQLALNNWLATFPEAHPIQSAF